MGLFSRKTIISVASSVRNLAGDINNRPDILWETAVSAVLAEKPIGGMIVDSYLRGSGIRLRSFGKWAEENFADVVGFSSGSLYAKDSINNDVLATQVPVTPGKTAILETAEIGEADFSWWADQYVAQNHPTLLYTNYSADLNDTTKQVTLRKEDDSLLATFFLPESFDVNADYLYASYKEATPGVTNPLETGSTIVLAPAESFPSTTGWSTVSTFSSEQTVPLTTTTTVDVTYSDTTPSTTDTTTTTTNDVYTEIHNVYRQTITLPSGGLDTIRYEESTMYHDVVGEVSSTTTTSVTTEDIGGGVIKTTTTTVVTESLTVERSYRIDTQEFTYGSWSDLKIFIYKKGTGNSILDAMFVSSSEVGSFLPFIPFRLNNYDVKDSFPDIYPKCKKAIKKALGAKYDSIRNNILYNEGDPDLGATAGLGDIDYCYTIFGATLNSTENAAKRYMYHFFERMMEDPNKKTALDYADWVATWNAADQSMQDWIAWRIEHQNSENSFFNTDPEPVRIPYPVMPVNSVKIGSTNPTMNINLVMKWNFISESTGSDLLDPNAKKGDLWFTVQPLVSFQERSWGYVPSGTLGTVFTKKQELAVVTLNWQVTPTEWKKIQIVGLDHTNYIYGGKSVYIRADQALSPLPPKPWETVLPDYEESGFIVPLHSQIYRDMGLVHGTQFATAGCYLMFNAYESRKQRWYEISFFRFVLVAAAIVITALTFFADGGSTIGAAVSVGAGLTAGSVPFLIATFAVNMIVATILVKVFTKIATELFGAEVGAVVGAILGAVAFGGLNGTFDFKSLGTFFGSALRIDNLMMLLNVTGNAYSQYLNKAAADMQAEANKINTEIESKLKEVEAKAYEMFGNSDLLDPAKMIELLSDPNEDMDSFLQRTLMVGSDLANLSINMLNNFTEITLSTELP